MYSTTYTCLYPSYKYNSSSLPSAFYTHQRRPHINALHIDRINKIYINIAINLGMNLSSRDSPCLLTKNEYSHLIKITLNKRITLQEAWGL